MLRQHSLRRWIGIVVFIAVVAASGYALSASGNMRNPFTVFSELSSLTASGEQGGDRPAFDQAGSGETRPEPPSGGFRGEGGGENQTTIQWSEIGGVLFNAWFIAAMSAVVMVVAPMVGFIIRQAKRVVHLPTLRGAAA